jgi:hypothetical protein
VPLEIATRGRAAVAAMSWFVIALSASYPGSVRAQSDQYGTGARKEAARQMLVVAVQQGISSLPPTSGQSFQYDFDPKLQTFARTDRLGPVSFRIPETIGDGNLSVRVALSYFELSESFEPITYSFETDRGIRGFTKFGLRVDAKVGLLNLAATYGLSDRWEATLNVPLVLVNPEVSQSFLIDPKMPENLVGAGSREQLEEFIDNGTLVLFDQKSRGFQSTQFGMGRASLGAKADLYSHPLIDAGLSAEVFFASPNEKEFSGSDSYAILPRAIAVLRPMKLLRVHLDAGYDYDFSESELRRFTWNAGASIPFTGLTVDFGVGGSEFDSPIHWTPDVAFFEDPSGAVLATFHAEESTTLGTSFVDFLGGVKFLVTDWFVLSGSVNVPLNDQGFRADAVGTIAAEAYF